MNVIVKKGVRRRGTLKYNEGMDVRTRRQAIKLAVCIGIFAFSALIRIVFPNLMQAMSDKAFEAITGNVDYLAAIETIGRGLNGEMDMRSAFSEAWTYAFYTEGKAEPAAASAVMEKGKM